MDDDDDRVWGIAPADAPVPRADFERALRGLNVNALAPSDLMMSNATE